MQLLEFENIPFYIIVLIFGFSALIIAVAGTTLTKYADIIADITKMGEALAGALLLGAVTSLAGVVTSGVAAYEGFPSLAVSNAIGGVAVQTAFLAVADIAYKKANLEHAAASFSNLLYSILLIALLSILMVMINGPELTILGVHPGSFLLILVYIFGMLLVHKAERKPMWRPISTRETEKDIPQIHSYKSKLGVWLSFILSSVVVIIAGFFVAESGIEIAERTQLTESFIGLMLTAVVTSLPELFVSISAVRQGSLTMAVGNIVGGNSFEILIVALADFLFKGSLLHHIQLSEKLIISLTILLMSILLMGLLFRQKHGIGGIGWESFSILVVFLLGYLVLFIMNF